MDFRKRVIFSVSIIVASFIVFGVLFYLSDLQIDANNEEITATRQSDEAKIEALNSLSTLKRDAAEAAELQKKMDALLPSQDSLFTFNQSMEAVARARGLALTSSFVGNAVLPAGSTPGSAAFTMNVAGPANDIAEFMKDIEFKGAKYIVALDGVTFYPDASGFRADITGRVFFK